MKIIEPEDFKPICPHCNERIEAVYRLSDEKGFFQGHMGYCFVCPNCEKILGFSDYSSS